MRSLLLQVRLSALMRRSRLRFRMDGNGNGWVIFFFVTKLAGFEYTKFFTKEAISAFNPIPIVRAQNVRMGFFEENKNEAISEMLSNQLKRSALNKKCLLMTFIGAGIGDTCIFSC